MNTLPPEPEPVPVPPPSAHQRVTTAYERLTEVDRPELWATLRPVEDVLVDAKAVDERVRTGEILPLAGLVFAVRDLVDVAGMPAAATVTETSATVVARLTGAGAVVLGKTSLDAVPSAWDRLKTAGGPGSAPAVAVALGIADFALGTDTAGTGRVPAALNAVVGLKPTPGLLSMTGVLPSPTPFDAVALFARNLVTGQRTLAVMTGPDPADPRSRDWPADVRLGVGEHPRIAIPDDAGLAPLCPAARHAFGTAVAALRASGAILERIDLAVFHEAGDAGQLRLGELRVAAAKALDGFAAMLVPTVLGHPDVGATDLGSRLGAYTAFANVLDLAAVTVPVLPQDRRPFGVTVLTRAFDDQIGLDLAAVCTGEPVTPYPEPGADVVVFGAHLRGQPLNTRLAELGARFTAPAYTAERYRMVLLGTEPAQPGIIEDADGTVLDGERWRLSPAALGRFAEDLPEPLHLGRVELDDGTRPLAVLCAPEAAAAARDLGRYASWRGYLRFLSTAGPRDPG